MNEQQHVDRPIAPESADPIRVDENGGDYIELPDGRNIAPNGAVIADPCADRPEVQPDHEYTPDKEDLNLMIM